MPARLSDQDRWNYERLVWLLHSLTYALTTRFLQDERSRDAIVTRLNKCVKELTNVNAFGCGDLCSDEKKGCVPCD